MNLFENLNIKNEIKQAIKEIGYETMTPIQESSLPDILLGKDVLAQAPTGTGKTACYGIPTIELTDLDNKNVQTLILCPTRELALQASGEIKKLSVFLPKVKVITIYGGQSIDVQIKGLKQNPQIVVGTPGRIMDHMRRGTLKIDNIKLLVLDEADEMLDMGFKEDLDTILEDVKSNHQTLLFSATISPEIKRITKQYQKEAIFVRTTFNEASVPNIAQYYVELLESSKTDCLTRMIDTYNFKQALVFCRTKKKVDEVSVALTSRGYPVECLHGDLKQAGREKVMELFREGLIRVLIATDVAARGLDISGIDVVFNYDIPDDPEYYTHRIGRTARAGRAGSSYTFVTKREVARLKGFENYTKTPIIKIAPPTYKMAEASKVRHTINDLIEYMANTDLKTYVDYIENAIVEAEKPFDPIELAAAFLKKQVDKDSKFKDSGQNLEVETPRRDRKQNTKEGSVRLFINLGKKDNLTKTELLELVRTKRHVDRKDITGIDILNTFSFFEVPTEKVPHIINTLKGMNYGGRTIDVEEAVGKKPKNESKNNSQDKDKEQRRNFQDKDQRKKYQDKDKDQRNKYQDKEKDSKRNYQDKDKEQRKSRKSQPKAKAQDAPKKPKRSNIQW